MVLFGILIPYSSLYACASPVCLSSFCLIFSFFQFLLSSLILCQVSPSYEINLTGVNRIPILSLDMQHIALVNFEELCHFPQGFIIHFSFTSIEIPFCNYSPFCSAVKSEVLLFFIVLELTTIEIFPGDFYYVIHKIVTAKIKIRGKM